MKEKLVNIIKYVFFLGMGVGITVYLFKDLKVEEIWQEAKTMDYSFFIYSSLFSLFAHFVRAARWSILIRSVGYQPRIWNVFSSVMTMNLFNILIPRSGEVVRCGTIYKYEKIPVKNLLGTVVVERLVDLLSLIFLTVVLVIINFPLMQTLYYNSAMPALVNDILNKKWLIFLVLAFGVLTILTAIIFRKKLLKLSIFQKLGKTLVDAKVGLIKMWKTKEKPMFLVHTFLLWAMYLGMLYINVFAYEPTKHLGFLAGFTLLVSGSYGMVAPTNGGVGAWHAMALLGFSAFGIVGNSAAAIVNVMFLTVTAGVAVHGVIALVLTPYFNKKYPLKETPNTHN